MKHLIAAILIVILLITAAGLPVAMAAELPEEVIQDDISALEDLVYPDDSVEMPYIPQADPIEELDQGRTDSENSLAEVPVSPSVTANAENENSDTAMISAFQSSSGIPIDPEMFPDAKFREYVLKNLDKNQDILLDDAEISSISRMDISGLGIQDLEGIQLFSGLQGLDCSENMICCLHLSPEMPLRQMICMHNRRSNLPDSFPVAVLGKGFDCNRVSQVTGGSFDTASGTFTFSESASIAEYTYDCGNGQTAVFTLQRNPSVTYEEVPQVEPDETHAGMKAHYLGSDGKLYIDRNGVKEEVQKEDLIIPPLKHVHRLEEVMQVNPTDSANGKKGYYHCVDCGRNFEDAEGAIEIKDLDSWGVLPKGHDLQFFEGKLPTCTEDGMLDVWICRTCKAMFADSSAIEPVSDRTIPKLGHDWEVSYSWDGPYCTAYAVCRHDPSHTQCAEVESVGYRTLYPTCTSRGQTTYYADFGVSWAEGQTKVQADIPALGHVWDQCSSQWAPDGTSCHAVRVCRRDRRHVQNADAQVTGEPMLDEKGEPLGKTKYTAKFLSAWASAEPLVLESEDPKDLSEPDKESIAFLTPWQNQIPETDHLGNLLISQPFKISGSELEEIWKALQKDPEIPGVTYQLGGASVMLDRPFLSELMQIAGTEGYLVISLESGDRIMSPQQAETLGDHNGICYRLTVKMVQDHESRTMDDLGGLAVSLPCNLETGQRVTVFCVGSDGSLSEIPGNYDKDGHTVSCIFHSGSSYLVRESESWVIRLAVTLCILSWGMVGFLVRRRKIK